jgi:S1-C subfamily serine protease
MTHFAANAQTATCKSRIIAAATATAIAAMTFWNSATAFAATPLEEVVHHAIPSVARVVLNGTFINDQGKPERTISVGTAFVIDNGGHMLTNCHVASDYGHTLITRTVQVVFGDDQSRYDAKVVGCDKPSDLGMLYVPSIVGKRVPLTFARTEDIRMGMEVVAVGFARNIDGVPTITRGIVSGVNRSLFGDFSDLVQTDAVLNHGNSGGPLMNMNGEVVGVNTYSYMGRKPGKNGETVFEDVPGIYMARSAGTAALFAQQLIDHGEISRADLGLSGISIDNATVDSLQLPSGGVYVKSVKPGSIAARAGIQAGHVIQAITVNGLRYEISGLGDLNNTLALINGSNIIRVNFMEFTEEGQQSIDNDLPLSARMVKLFYTDATIPSVKPAPTQTSGAQNTRPATHDRAAS